MNYKVGDTITYYEAYNTTEGQYLVEEVYRSFLVCKSLKTSKSKHIYKEFYKNIKENSNLKAVK